MEITNEITEQLQKECHEAVELIMKKNKKVSYQDATNVWLFSKLSEYQKRISRLEDRTSGLQRVGTIR